jgi:16S rRNA (guanine527-N7)-methyltransferase
VTDPYEIAIKHYVDSITAVPFINPDASILDVGSGGGFPGIPLKVMLPSLSVTLLEARRKRVSFLKHALRSMGMVDVNVINNRLEKAAELLAQNDGFDVIVSRAFSNLKTFVAHSLPLLNSKGCLLAYKGVTGDKLDGEMESLRNLGFRNRSGDPCQKGFRLHIEMKSFILPWLEEERNLIIITGS